jgi:polysaccharide biosynthesis transport protein
LLRDRIDDHVRGVFDLEAQADAPALGLIPSFWPGWQDPRGRLVMVTKPHSIVAEAYRGLRTRLLPAGQANTKAVLVTSPGWEDKSTVAANLAVAIAQSGRSVVLVCADLRWGRAHKLFAPVNGYGLSGLLEGRTGLADALHATEVPGLRLLPPGVAPADSAALLGRLAWRLALGDMRMLADTVIIEAPPVLTGADLQPVANFTEMILMVADAKRTTRAQLRVAAREVRRMRGNLAGCVLDNVGARRRLRSARPEPVADGHAEADGPAMADSHAALTATSRRADSDTADLDLPDAAGPAQALQDDPVSAAWRQDGESAPGS